MKEYKYRFWDKHNKRWATPKEIRMTLLTDEEMFGDDLTVFHLVMNDYEICEYVDCKDKYGIGVYRGSIVKFEDGSIGVVEWSQWHSNYWVNMGGDTPFRSVNWTYYGRILPEVIGHVLENPELIKKGESNVSKN